MSIFFVLHRRNAVEHSNATSFRSTFLFGHNTNHMWNCMHYLYIAIKINEKSMQSKWLTISCDFCQRIHRIFGVVWLDLYCRLPRTTHAIHNELKPNQARAYTWNETYEDLFWTILYVFPSFPVPFPFFILLLLLALFQFASLAQMHVYHLAS